MDVQDARRRTVSWLRTARGVAVEEVAFFSVLKPGTFVALSYADDPDVWHEALVTRPSLCVDRAASILGKKNLISNDSLGRTSGDSNPLSNRSEILRHLEKADTVSCGEEPTRVFPGAFFEILLHIGGGLAAQVILTVVQKSTNSCPRRAKTSGGAVDDRVRGRR